MKNLINSRWYCLKGAVLLLLLSLVSMGNAQTLPNYNLIKTANVSQAGSMLGFGMAAYQNMLYAGVPNWPGKGAVIPYTMAGNSLTQGTIITPPTATQSGANFGFAVAVYDKWMVVGAPIDKRSSVTPSAFTGSAYIYENVSGTWTLRNTIVDIHNSQTVKANNYLGSAVAMNSTYAFVGIPLDDSVGNVFPYSSSNNGGSVIIYKRSGSTWSRVDKLAVPSGITQSEFGTAITCSENELFVSAPSANGQTGKVFRFTLVAGSWVFQNAIDPIVSSGKFGNKMGLSGKYLFVGLPAYSGSTGEVHVYYDSLSNGNWKYQQKIQPAYPRTNASFGTFALDVYGDRAIIGEMESASNKGQLNMYALVNGKWTYSRNFVEGVVANNDKNGFTGLVAGNYIISSSPYNDAGGTDAGQIYAYKSAELLASQLKTDGYVDLEWRISTAPAQTPTPVEMYFQIIDSATGQEIYSKRFDDLSALPFISGTYRHYVKPQSSIVYHARLLAYGSGTLMTGPFRALGTTKPFVAPIFSNSTPTSGYLQKVELSFVSNSTYADKIQVYRGGNKIAILDSSVKSFTDNVDIANTSAILNGNTYNYCLEGVNSVSLIQSAKNCSNGGTVAVNFTASDNSADGGVTLSWNNLSAYGQYIIIERDGVRIKSVASNIRTYKDETAIPGQVYTYAMVVVSDEISILKQQDQGSVIANGVVEGYVLNKTGGYGVAGVTVNIKAVVNNETIDKTTTTDSRGFYQLSKLFYGSTTEFKVKASKSGVTFTETEKTVSLTLDVHKQTVNFESNITGTVLSLPSGITVSSFTAVPNNTKDLVALNMNFVATGDVQVYLKRNEVVIQSYYLKNGDTKPVLFNDLTGIPADEYKYAFEIIQLSGNKIYKKAIEQIAIFPLVAPLAAGTLNVVANDANGTVDMSWQHTSANYNGVAVYLNNVKLGEYTPADLSIGTYTEKTAANNVSQNYELRTFRICEDKNRYESKGTQKTVVYPVLKPVNTAVVTITKEGYYRVSWKQSFDTSLYNYTATKVIRVVDGLVDTMATVNRLFGNYFIDKNTPCNKTTVAYRLINFKSKYNLSAGFTASIATPVSLDSVATFSASNSGLIDGVVNLNWSYTSNKIINGFRIISGTDTLWKLANEFSATYLLKGNYTNSTRSFEIRPYRKIGSTLYFGLAAMRKSASNSFPAGNTMPAVSNLNASQNLPDKVTVSWTYPSYYLPEFKIYRDGYYLASVYNDARIYNDYVYDGFEHVYSVIPVLANPANRGRTVSATGKRILGIRVFGTASNAYSGNGIPNAGIYVEEQATNPVSELIYRTIGFTKTDSNGSFNIDNLPLRHETRYRVSIDAPNNLIANNNQFFMNYEQQSEQFTFVDTMQQMLENSDNISTPIRLKAKINVADNSIELSWGSDGPNYSGFEVYRGLNVLEKIPAGMPFFYADHAGAPGYGYTYRVRTYWENEPGNILKSDFVVINIDYPKLLPATNFVATPAKDFLQFTWDHVSDKHSYYEITRNGATIGQVKTGTAMLFNDTSGAPGINYLYQVTAVSTQSGGVFKSDKLSLNVVYPDKSKVQDLTTTTDSNLVKLKWNPISDFNVAYRIYRDGKLLATTTANPSMGLLNQYDDSTGVPNQKYRYDVRAVYVRNRQAFESKAVYSDYVFPKFAIPRITAISVTAITDGVIIGWTYNYKAVQSFKIYRAVSNGTQFLIGTVTAGQRTFTDYSGAPLTPYDYYVSAVDNRSGQIVESLKSPKVSGTFPRLSSPKNVVIAVNSLNTLSINWDYDNPSDSIEFEISESYSRTRKYYAYNFPSCSQRIINEYLSIGSSVVPKNTRLWKKLDHTNMNLKGVSNGLSDAICLIYSSGYDDYYDYFYLRAVKTINGVKYYSNLIQLVPQTPSRRSSTNITSFSASDNAYNNKVYLQWAITSNTDVKAYNIYRDGSLLETVDPNQYDYYDEDPVPGKKHVYSILADYNTGGTGSAVPRSDIGSSSPVGVINGAVTTFTGGNAVPGATITATATIDNEKYEYKATTDAEGKYELSGIYFGIKAKYSITASYPNHIFDNPTQTATLESAIPRATLADFRDKTAFVITGNINYKDGCGMDSLKVKLITAYKNGTPNKVEESVTSKGKYSFVVNPADPNLLSMELVVSDTQTRAANARTTYHRFDVNKKKWTSFNNWPLQQVFDFTDNLVYPLNIAVRNTCGLLGSYQFVVDIKDEKGCVSKKVITATNGKLSLQLPPYKYELVVSSASPLDANITSVIDYLSVRPIDLDIAAMRDTGADLALRNGSLAAINLDMVYHKKPKISITNSIAYLCNNPNNPVFLRQGDTAKMQLAVTETHGSTTCHVDNGFIIVRNDASEVTEDEVHLKDGQKAFNLFSFPVGAPLVVEPYTKELIFEYHTESDGFLCELIKACAIDGIAQQKGSDVIVDSREGQDFQIPLMVLRDPPGDESYSYIEKGTTFTRTLSMSDKNSGYGGIRSENQFEIFGVGAAFETEIKAAGGTGRSAEYEISVTTTERVETPAANSVVNADNTNFLLGSNGDVIVGSGVAMGYGIGERISIDNATCTIKKTSIVTIAPEKVNTTWVYTVDHIKKLINDYRNDSTLLEQGLYEITGRTTDQARQDLKARIMNWESVLKYHFYDNVPYVQLCNLDNYSSTPEPFRSQINNWVKQGFCKDAGSYTLVNGKEKFVPKTDLKFTQAMLDKYNACAQVVANLQSKDYQFKFNDGLVFSEAALRNWNIDAGAKQFYGIEAENITFSGNTSYEKSVTVAQSKSRGHEQHWSMDMDFFFGVVNEQDVKLITLGGFGVMVGTEKQIVEFNTKTGAIFGYNTEFERTEVNSSAKENTVGYVLTDNDAGDQFSVTIFRGNDPLATPYFSLLGGRSSCPPEPGTILRDQPLIRLQDEQGNFVNSVQYDLDPDKILTLPVKFSNLAPQIFNDEHYFTLGQVQNMNRFGAKLWMNGTRLGTTEFRIPSGGSVYSNLEIERSDKFYDFDDVYISLAASCPNLEMPDNYTANDHLIQLHYRHPCSEVSILNPGENWVIRKATTQTGDPDEKMTVRIADYDVENQLLEKITLQYRRIGSDIWNDIQNITRDSLSKYYQQNKSTYPDPVYPFIWNIKGNAGIVDGDYELRAQSWCGKGGVIYSNVVKGKIDRTTVVLFGQPQPADHLLSLGDEVSVTFNKNIICGLTNANYSFKNAATNAELPVTVSCFGNKLVFTFVDPIASLDGVMVKATVTNIKDLNENTLGAPIEWMFKISNNPVYFAPDVLNYQMYQGKTAKLNVSLLNTFVATQNYTLSLKGGTWLQASPLSGVVLPSGKEVTLTFNSNTLVPGNYTDTVVANIPGYSLLQLPVNLTVYPKPVNWQVDPSKFENSATVICNYTMDSTEIYSTDTLDRIAAFINGEVRGVTNIVKAGNFYRAYLNIFGNAGDVGKPVVFNVWRAKTGVEYAAAMRGPVNFTINGFYGTTIAPRILDVNSVKDSIRYIPLKQGWNHLAFNTVINSTDINEVLGRLKTVDGDIIKTLTKTSYFNAAAGKWISTSGGISNVSHNAGYMIKLAKADTLKVWGIDAPLEGTFDLQNGWNLVGNPYQENKAINDAFNGIAFSNGAKIKNDAQAADYDSATKKWNGITNLQMNKSYLLKNGKTATMVYNRGADLDCQQMVTQNFEMNSTFLAEIKLNGIVLNNATDKVVAFSGEQCRGTGTLEFIPSINKYGLNMFVYSNTQGEKITFKIYSQSTGQWYDVADTLTFASNGQYGTPAQLWVFSNRKDFNNGTKNAGAANMNALAYPNPFNNEISIKYESSFNQRITVELIDLQGRVVYAQNLKVETGLNNKTLRIDQQQMVPGMYYLRISDGINIPYVTRLNKN